MINNPTVVPLFPEAGLYINVLNINNKKVIEYIKKINFNETQNTKDKQSTLSYISNNFNVFNDIKFLKEEIDKEVKNYLYKIMEHNMSYKYLNSWITKTEPNGFSREHTHSNTFLSGVYYPIGAKGFKISFFRQKNNFWEIQKDLNNVFNAHMHTFAIEQDNTLMLFPSDLKHKVAKNDSNETRYSIAFNINPFGTIGFGDCQVTFN